MSLERPHSRASSGSRGPPPTPPPTYLWEEVRRSRSKGGYPWTILYKPPLPDQLDIELLLKGEISTEHFGEEKVRGRSACPSDKRAHIRNRLRDRERSRRARSEPTPSLPSSNTVSLSNMDQAIAADPTAQSDELDDFPLPDEDIPDFVMAYLQSDKGNLDEDIPDHILEYIQSRAAILERSQQHMKQTDDEIFYTKDEMRIMDETRKRLEEQGELNVELSTVAEDTDAFDQFFQRAAAAGQDSALAFPGKSEQAQTFRQLEEAEPEVKKSKKGGKFKIPNITMPNKSQLNIKLPKFGPGRKKAKDTEREQKDDEGAERGKKLKPARRPHSSSPMRQKINQQLESWNNSLKKLKSRSGRNQDGQVKSFVALLPGRSSKPTKTKEPENQYEEVGPPRSNPAAQKRAEYNSPMTLDKATVESAEDKVRFSHTQENEAEETMEDIENLPESEVAEVARDGMIVDREVADVIVTRGEFVDIDIDEDFEDDDERMGAQTEIEQGPGGDKTVVEEPATGFAARSKKAYELTKSKIQTSLSKEQLQATRNKLQSTLSKQNLQATRKKVQSSLSKKNLQATRDKLQSTLSKENFAATRNKIQTSLNSTLSRKKSKTEQPQMVIPQENIFTDFPHDNEREYETSTPVERKTKYPIRNKKTSDEEYPHEANPPMAKRRNKKPVQPIGNELIQTSQSNECNHIQEETEEDLEDELEPKLEFSIHGSDRPRPSSVSQSTETLPEEESDKENVVVRPKRQRYRHRRHGFHEEFGRPHSAHVESNIRSSWVEKTNAYPTISQEMLSAFCAPVNSLEAVDSNFGSMRKPDRPVRTRSKKELNSTTEDHLYSNVPPRRAKRGQRKTLTDSSNDGNMKTWPRKAGTVERPVVPKRCKSKHSNKPVFSVCSNYQTWPRRSTVQSPPTAPKRTRSRGKINCQHATNLRDLEGQIRMPTSNILTDADTLFGAESRFIDEETDTDRSLQRIASSNNCQLDYNIPGEPPVGEAKILNSSPRPLAPTRNKNHTGSLHKPKRASVQNCGETTWPRMSKTQPSAPQRRKLTLKKKEKTEIAAHLDLEKPSKKLPTVPASTPSEEEAQEISYAIDGESTSSVQAGLDQILEILASTFPQESIKDCREENKEIKESDKQEAPITVVPEKTTPQADFFPVNLHEEEEMIDENPYAEIKQFQKRTPPPRPPPPVYVPASASSYSYIYTVPRRKKGISNSVSPERPPRTYCTIRPHRPPRKFRTRTQENAFQSTEHSDFNLVRRHSFSGGDDAKEERDLQSAPVIERMRARPLPAPPRAKRNRSRSPPHKPPRSRTSSLRRHKTSQPEDVCVLSEEVATTPEITTVQQTNVDEYEPIENPVQVEEISVGIQTDPLPEYEESVAEPNETEIPIAEINNNLYDQHERVQEPEPVIVERPVHPQEEVPVPVSAPISVPIQVTAPIIFQPEVAEQQTSCPPVVWSAANSPDSEPDFTEPVSIQQNHEVAAPKVQESVKCSTQQSASRSEEEDEANSFSRIPAHFLRSIAPLPPIQVDLPTRLQLSDLDVERLNVREVMADRLIVSSVDTNSLQVCQMTTSNASGQLVFNIGPGATIPFLTDPRETDVGAERQTQSSPTISCFSPTTNSNVMAETPMKSDTVKQEEWRLTSSSTPGVKPKLPPPSEATPVQQEEFASVEEPGIPSTSNGRAPVAHSTGDRQSEEPSVSSLAMQLASVSSRHLMNGACVAATETYIMAQRVAELGLQQLNEQLHRRGIHFDDKEKDDLKAVLLMLLIVVCAIFLLGMGKQRISTHWDFYFPN